MNIDIYLIVIIISIGIILININKNFLFLVIFVLGAYLYKQSNNAPTIFAKNNRLYINTNGIKEGFQSSTTQSTGPTRTTNRTTTTVPQTTVTADLDNIIQGNIATLPPNTDIINLN